MTICSVAPHQLMALKKIIPNSLYWQAQCGLVDTYAVQDEDGIAQAIMIAELYGSVTELLWLWVSPSYQEDGLEQLLLSTLILDGVDAGTNWLETTVPCLDEYENILSMMIEMNGDMDLVGSLFVTTLGEVDLGRVEGFVHKETGIPLGQAESWQLKEVLHILRLQNMPAQSNLVTNCYDPNLSRIYYHDGSVKGMLLVESGEHLCLSYLWCEKGWGHILPALLVLAVREAKAHWPPDTELYTSTVVDSAFRLGETFLPKARIVPVVRYRIAIG